MEKGTWLKKGHESLAPIAAFLLAGCRTGVGTGRKWQKSARNRASRKDDASQDSMTASNDFDFYDGQLANLQQHRQPGCIP